MIGLDRMLLSNIIETKMASANNETRNKELISMMCDAVAEAIAKNNDQIEMDFTPETDQHCCT